MDTLIKLTAFNHLTWQMPVMWALALFLLYLAIARGLEPLLLVPLSFGALLANLPSHHFILEQGGQRGIFEFLHLGLHSRVFPCLLFLGIGALTDFGPLIASPRTLILGAAAQVGVLLAFIGASALGFSVRDAAAVSIIGAGNGAMSIYASSLLSPRMLATTTIAAYAYMSLVPLIQPPIMRALTTVKERKIRMQSLRAVSRVEKILFIGTVTFVALILVPESAPLLSMLMLGNLLRESGCTERLAQTSQNELLNIVTIFLGVAVGLTMQGDLFLHTQTLAVLVLGLFSFALSTAAGVLTARVLNLLFPKRKINPLIGAAGVAALPMAARTVHFEGQRADRHNFLLMHAMGPSVASVIGTALIAGYFISTAAP